MTPGNLQQLANFIWSIADLRGPYRPPQYECVMLPLTVLRRFDAVLDATKESLLQKYDSLKEDILSYVLRQVRPCVDDAWIDRTNLIALLIEVTE